jgi:hypothetical protein
MVLHEVQLRISANIVLRNKFASFVFKKAEYRTTNVKSADRVRHGIIKVAVGDSVIPHRSVKSAFSMRVYLMNPVVYATLPPLGITRDVVHCFLHRNAITVESMPWFLISNVASVENRHPIIIIDVVRELLRGRKGDHRAMSLLS